MRYMLMLMIGRKCKTDTVNILCSCLEKNPPTFGKSRACGFDIVAAKKSLAYDI